MEYLAAQGLVEQIKGGDTVGWSQLALPQAVVDFVVEMKPPQALFDVRVNAGRRTPELGVLAGNALTVLGRLRREGFRGIDITEGYVRGADLRFVDLTRLKYAQAHLHECNLIGAQFKRREFNRLASFRDCMFGIAVVCGPGGSDSRDRIARLHRKLNFQGVAVESATWHGRGDSHFVGVMRTRIADSDNLNWLEQALGRERWVRAKAIYAEEYESLAKSFSGDVVRLIRATLEGAA